MLIILEWIQTLKNRISSSTFDFDSPNLLEDLCFGFENEEFNECETMQYYDDRGDYQQEYKVTNMDKFYTVVSTLAEQGLYNEEQLSKQTVFKDNSYARLVATSFIPNIKF